MVDKVDAYVVVHAGRAAEETGNLNDIWSIKWTLPQEREVDGRVPPTDIICF
jgi:immune inhibitor A